MSELTNKIQDCGIHCKTCGSSVYAITEKEASAIVDVCRDAYVDAIKSGHRCDSPLTGTEQAIASVLKVK